MSFNLDLDDLQTELDYVRKVPGGPVNEKFLQLPKDEGTVIIRILPARDGERIFSATRIHYNINGRAFHCLREKDGKWWRGDCPLCNVYNGYYDRAKNASSESEAEQWKKKAKSIKPVDFNYYNVIAREVIDPKTRETKTNVGPLVARLGKLVHGLILEGILGNPQKKEKPLGNITHPTTGRDFKISKSQRKSPDGLFTDYSGTKFLDISEAGTPEEFAHWLKNLNVLGDIRKNELKTYDELAEQVQILLGQKEDPSASFNFGATPTNKVVHAPSAQISKPSSSVDEMEIDLGVVEDDFVASLQRSLEE